jgi:hypothetical protein
MSEPASRSERIAGGRTRIANGRGIAAALVLGGERSPDRHGFPPKSGNRRASNVGGGASRFGAGSNLHDAGVYRAAWPLDRD